MGVAVQGRLTSTHLTMYRHDETDDVDNNISDHGGDDEGEVDDSLSVREFVGVGKASGNVSDPRDVEVGKAV